METIKGLVKAVSLKNEDRYGILIEEQWYNGQGDPPQKNEQIELGYEENKGFKNIQYWKGLATSPPSTTPNVDAEMKNAMHAEDVYEHCYSYMAALLNEKTGRLTDEIPDEAFAAMVATLFIQKMRK